MPPTGITIKINADAGDLQAQFAKARSAIDALGNKTGEQSSRIGKNLKTAFDLGTRAISGSIGALTSFKTLLISTLAVVGTTKLAKAFGDASEYVDKLGKRAKVLDIPIEQLSALSYAADLAGVDIDRLGQMAAKAMRRVAEEVEKGHRSLEGVRLTDPLTGRIRDINELLPAFAARLSNVKDQAEKIRLGEKIFGKGGGTEFVQLMNETGAQLQRWPELIKSAQRTGAIFTPEQAKRAQEFNDAARRVSIAWRGVKFVIADEVAPTLTKFLDAAATGMGTLANTIPKLAAMLRDLAGGSDDPQKRQAIDNFIRSGKNLAVTAAIEVGRVGGTAFIAAVTAGLAAIGPVIEDIFRDAVGPVLNQIPGAGIDLTLQQQLSAERQSLSAILNADANRGIRGKASMLDWELHNLSLTNDQFDEKTRQLELLKLRIAELDAVTAESASKVSRLQEQIAQQTIDRSERIAKSISQSIETGMPVLDTARDRLAKSLEQFQSDAAVLSDLSSVSPGGSEASPGRGWLDGFADWITSGGKRLIDSVNGAVPGIAKAGKELAGVRRELQIRLLEATGDKFGAERLRLEDEFEAQNAWARRFTPGLMPEIQRVQQARFAELDRRAAGEPRDPNEKPVTFREGWSAAIHQIEDRTKNWGQTTKSVLGDAVESFSAKLASALAKGEMNFRNFGKAIGDILGDVVQTSLQAVLQFAIYGAVGQGLKGLGLFGLGDGPKSAEGNVFERGRLVPHAAGGIVDRLSYFPMAGGAWGSIAEQNRPEAILPLQRVNGKLGVMAAGGGGGTVVNVYDQRRGGEPVQVRESQGPNGQRQIDVLILESVRRGVASGALDRALDANYGLRRRGIVR